MQVAANGEIQVINAVIHGFEKEQHKKTDLDSIVIKDKGLNVTLPAVKTLVSGVAKLLGGKMNTQSWGRFDKERGGKFYAAFNRHVHELSDVDTFIGIVRGRTAQSSR